jgi:hypothetical protein
MQYYKISSPYFESRAGFVRQKRQEEGAIFIKQKVASSSAFFCLTNLAQIPQIMPDPKAQKGEVDKLTLWKLGLFKKGHFKRIDITVTDTHLNSFF